ncbi:MAG TPA: YceI family protein [Polyangiaceae bacterium]|nr:YceI family protein [Polyangiaceae bacterium]
MSLDSQALIRHSSGLPGPFGSVPLFPVEAKSPTFPTDQAIHTEIATLFAGLRGYRGRARRRIFRAMNTMTRDAITQWSIDPIHTTVAFSVRHLMVTNVRGVFARVSGSVRYDAANPAAAEIRAAIPVESIDTRSAQRDAHLRSADFFDAEHFPLLTFQSSRVFATGVDSLEIGGLLTMHGVTRAITLDVAELSSIAADHNGQPRLGGRAVTKLKRSDFGMTFNKLLEGGLAISDEVSLHIDFSLQRADGG